jgi:hypothetical protein
MIEDFKNYNQVIEPTDKNKVRTWDKVISRINWDRNNNILSTIFNLKLFLGFITILLVVGVAFGTMYFGTRHDKISQDSNDFSAIDLGKEESVDLSDSYDEDDQNSRQAESADPEYDGVSKNTNHYSNINKNSIFEPGLEVSPTERSIENVQPGSSIRENVIVKYNNSKDSIRLQFEIKPFEVLTENCTNNIDVQSNNSIPKWTNIMDVVEKDDLSLEAFIDISIPNDIDDGTYYFALTITPVDNNDLDPKTVYFYITIGDEKSNRCIP